MKKHLLYILVPTLLFALNGFPQGSCCDYAPSGQNPGPGEDSETFGVGLGDIDGDGDLDAVVVDAYDDMEVYLNNGSGNFSLSQSYGSSDSWFDPTLVDVDMDGDLDIVVSAFYSGSGSEVWENDGSGSFSLSQSSIGYSISMRNITIVDLNDDGAPDIFTPAYSSGNGEVWLNDGNGTFINSNQPIDASSATQAALADFDGDGDLDAFIARTNGAANKVFINVGSAFFSDTQQALGSAFSNGAQAADVDDDGDMDVVVANWQSPSKVWLNDGNAVFTEGPDIDNDNYAKGIEISDIDYDCDPDVILGSYGSNGLQVWTNDGAGNFDLCFENSNSIYSHGIAVGDMNNNLMPDIWLGNFSSSAGDYIFLKSTPVFVNDTILLCEGDSTYIGCDWQTSTGDYLQAINCDTLCWYHVAMVLIDSTVTLENTVLTAPGGYDAYQWFDCNTMTAIVGADSNVFDPDTTGTYAVEITQESCVDTSECFFVQTPLADFSADPTYGLPPLMVDFTDLSLDSVNTWEWDFGDGGTSTEQHPDYEYTEPGLYSVKLKITGPGGIDSITKQDYIDVFFDPPTADFIGEPTSGLSPLEVQFTDLSVDSVNNWYWHFGDGEVGYIQNPLHTYDTAGTYTVSLSVDGPGGSDMMEKVDYISVEPDIIQADFSGSPTIGQSPLTVDFIDLSIGEIDSWKWAFGDGDSASIQNPSHEYLNPGSFTVSLTVDGIAGTSTETKVDYILIPVAKEESAARSVMVYPNPVSDFLYIDFNKTSPFKIYMRNNEGKTVLQKTANSLHEKIDVSALKPGVYSLIVESEDGSQFNVKVVKD
ncbi:MAG: FG-GAP-like repeat-containing protein [Bacteroidales bacterium]|nr:FG-GAP-like repeat-containing protein [Bacteroidales bacterium]MCF8396987.1 FG-GAP-like repeat-containing protein [Bacteroidales bacterium]